MRQLSEAASCRLAERLEPTNYFLDTLGVRNVWSLGLRGQGIGVAGC